MLEELSIPAGTETLDPADLPRDFKPYFVVEMDAERSTPQGLKLWRRSALVVAVDQDMQEYYWVVDLGPATGAMPLFYALNSGSDWAQVLDIMARMKEDARPAKTTDAEEAALLREYILNDMNEETRLAEKAASSYGPAGVFRHDHAE